MSTLLDTFVSVFQGLKWFPEPDKSQSWLEALVQIDFKTALTTIIPYLLLSFPVRDIFLVLWNIVKYIGNQYLVASITISEGKAPEAYQCLSQWVSSHRSLSKRRHLIALMAGQDVSSDASQRVSSTCSIS